MAKLSKKDYQKFKNTAYEMIVVQDCTQKRVSEVTGISEKTISEWATTGGWRDLRRARQSAVNTANNNLKNIISLLSEQRLTKEQEIHEAQASGDKDLELQLRKEANVISDDLSKINKTLKDNDKSNGITIGLFIDIMDDIFNKIRFSNYRVKCPNCGTEINLYNETLELQAMIIQQKTIEIG
jgi:hypothetical protein